MFIARCVFRPFPRCTRGVARDQEEPACRGCSPSHVRVFLALLGALQVIHPTLNKHFLSDTAWTFSMYLESMAIVPQLFMFQKQAKGIVEVLVSILKFRV